MSNVASVLKAAKKTHGDSIGGKGMAFPDVERLRTGIVPFDIASGGGIPLNRMTMVYGPESSGKTNFTLTCIARYQKKYPDKTCVFIDIEQATPTPWMEKMGVDIKNLVPIRPTYAEQIVDLVEHFLYAEDCGMIALDSIAAMATMQELKGSAEKEAPGTQSRCVSKLVRRCTSALGDAERGGRCPTLLWVNQIRYKIGVMFGNPETFPGGEAQRFMAALRVRLAGKNLTDPKVSKTMPVFKRTSGVIQKWKQPICTPQFRYDMTMVPHNTLSLGECADWDTMKQYLNGLGLIEKIKGGYEIKEMGIQGSTHAKLWLQLREKREEFTDLVVSTLTDDPTALVEAEDD